MLRVEAAGRPLLGRRRGSGATVQYVEWVPGVSELCLVGDFNDWEVGAHPATVDDYGVWRLFISDNVSAAAEPQGAADAPPQPVIPHGSHVRVAFKTSDGQLVSS